MTGTGSSTPSANERAGTKYTVLNKCVPNKYFINSFAFDVIVTNSAFSAHLSIYRKQTVVRSVKVDISLGTRQFPMDPCTPFRL